MMDDCTDPDGAAPEEHDECKVDSDGCLIDNDGDAETDKEHYDKRLSFIFPAEL